MASLWNVCVNRQDDTVSKLITLRYEQYPVWNIEILNQEENMEKFQEYIRVERQKWFRTLN
jgi:hypothetical protein